MEWTLERRKELCALKGITLDGKRAVISGAGNRFATVTAVDSGINFEWAWSAVEFVTSFNRGHFVSNPKW